MGRFVYSMASIKLSPFKVVTIEEGGTGASTRAGAIASLNGISRLEKGAPNGVTVLGTDGKIDLSFFQFNMPNQFLQLTDSGFVDASLTTVNQANGYIQLDERGLAPANLNFGAVPTINGIGNLFTNQVYTYTITNFDMAVNYAVSAATGTVQRNNDQITYTAPSIPGTHGFTINGKLISILVIAPYVVTPNLILPASGATLQTIYAVLTTDAFATVGANDTHQSTSWEVSTDSNFTTIVSQSTNDINNLKLWQASNLLTDTTYFARVRYKGTTLGYSPWSPTRSFNIVVPKINKPAITAPAAGAISNNASITFSVSAFSVYGGSDAHLSTSWQLALDANFTNFVGANYDSTTDKTSWSVAGLATNTTYYVRVCHKGSALGYSEWSVPISFTVKLPYVNTPAIAYPAAGATGLTKNFTVTSSAFLTTNGSDTHQMSSWQLASDAAFTNIIASSIDSTTDKTSWAISNLVGYTTYYLRVKHKGQALGYTGWSTASSFTTGQILVPVLNTPSITAPAAGQQGLTINPSLYATAFSVTDGSDSHVNTTWQIATDVGFSNIVAATYDDATNKTGWYVTGLSYNTLYYCRVRYRGAALGQSSWSAVSTFKTVLPNVVTPIVTSPAANTTSYVTTMSFTSNAFSVNNGPDSHLSTSWQLATDSGFSNIVVAVYDSTTDKTTWSVSGLANNTTYYVRVIHKGVTFGYSGWSNAIAFTVTIPGVVTPSVTAPANGSTGQTIDLTFSSTAFVASGRADSHLNSSWQIATDAAFSNIVVATYDDVNNKTAWYVGGLLSEGTTYYVRVSHCGSLNGWSAWGAANSFTTVPRTYPQFEAGLIYETDTAQKSTGYGNSIALSEDGTTAIVGAYSRDYSTLELGNLTACGFVYIYVRSGNTWTLQQSFCGPNPKSYDFFGVAVAISSDGNTIAVGASSKSIGNGTGPGANGGDAAGMVFIYTRSNGVWYTNALTNFIRAPLNNLAPDFTSNFGSSIALSGDGTTLVVGAFNTKAYAISQGMACIYRWDGSTWGLVKKFTGSDSAEGDRFGMDVAISSDKSIVAIAAPEKKNVNGYNEGAVYILSLSGADYVQTAKIISTTRQTDEYFGNNIALNADGSYLIVAAVGENFFVSKDGAAYGFRRSGNAWAVDTKFSSPVPTAYGYFGRCVGINSTGKTIIITEETGGGISHIFRYNGTSWIRTTTTLASRVYTDGFGNGVAISGNGLVAAVGAYNRLVTTTKRGGVFFYI